MEMDQIYSEGSWRLFEELDVSLDPPGPDSLFEVAAPFLEPGPGGHVVIYTNVLNGPLEPVERRTSSGCRATCSGWRAYGVLKTG